MNDRTVIDMPSPNFGPRRGGPVDMLILHYTGMNSAEDALARLCDPAAEVSAHYLIDQRGIIYRLVDDQCRAWHAGIACWAGETDINNRSIGIELVNPGHEFGYEPFPPRQMAALIALGQAIVERHPIPPWRVLGHSDVAPARKTDPGELFDWERLARAGLGIWPTAKLTDAPTELASVQRDLADFGYEIAVSGIDDTATRGVVTAFQRHFRPARIDGAIDIQTARLARWAASCVG